ncbi:MAG: 4-oxalocrotonate tautomerase family protein [Sphingobium sp.]|nr:4-oxalocrotonate tautomerase family protein [Sphingobium sp.]MCP5400108.1 4-oxalocrotonate tautomerase family protein [Sphingomonas sp.]
MPIINVNILSGRTVDQKRALIRELTDAAVRTIDVQPSQVRVIINEVAPEHWGTGGVSKADQGGGA